MSTAPGPRPDMSFAVRQKIARRARRARALQYLRHETFWVVVLIAMAILVVTQFVGIVGRA